jgi:nucleotide-binding universal stress UspA family protein
VGDVLRRILIGLDGSPLAETIVDAVCALSERLRADIVLLHVVEVPDMVRAVDPGPSLDEIVAQECDRARAYLDRVAATIRGRGLPIHTAVSAGIAAKEIVRFAERERIDLVALATHGRSGLGRWIHGSVADAVLHDAPVPLLLLRPTTEGERTPAISRLVIPLDGSSLAEEAIPVAEELARALAVPVLLVRVVEPLSLPFATSRSSARPRTSTTSGSSRFSGATPSSTSTRRRAVSVRRGSSSRSAWWPESPQRRSRSSRASTRGA